MKEKEVMVRPKNSTKMAPKSTEIELVWIKIDLCKITYFLKAIEVLKTGTYLNLVLV
jgi:hypothetical protein